ncbi:hypothetical protein [Serratia fonticola]|uniref:Uncharacterized protein n=1 Tax=Serratia fonticola TaxID=47917 RepID=A0ABY9PJU7_SERFO|nr:hypothetical protein [Serratia fonticola]WMT13142.1 hypothetical protein RFB13_18130 [Serratia fonticola]
MPVKLNWSVKYYKRCGAVLALCATIALLVMGVGCHSIVGGIAENVYPDLAQPEETEAPVTFTSYPSSVATEAILGGQAAGLNCSIPSLADRVAFKHSVGSSDISLRFRQACVMHDLCYRHGYATYGYTQADCDTQLQQSAFRLCRQFQEQHGNTLTDVRTMYQSCEKEAKAVLLGVSLAGAGSFRDRTRSTYFEYDPMPTRANDYVVGRAMPENLVSDPNADYGVRAFLFKRNLVGMRVLGANGQKAQANAPVPEARLATPPMLTGLADSESKTPATLASLDSLTREASDTSVKLVHFGWLSNGSPPQLTLTLCPDDCSSETDASVKKFAIVEGKPVMVSLTHRGTTGNTKEIKTVKIVQQELLKPNARKNDKMTDYPLNGPMVTVRNPYRFLSHDMLLEKDAIGQASWAWVFARGAPLNKNGTFGDDDSGKNYTDYVTVARQRLGNNHADEVQRFTLNVKETDEPLSLVRTDNAGHSVLVSMAWSEADLKRVESDKPAKQPPLLKLWRKNAAATQPETRALPVQMAPDTTMLTPLIVRLSSQPDPLIVIPQVQNNRWQHVETQAQANDDVLKIDFTVATIKTDKSLDFGPPTRLHCALSLNRQLQSPEAKVLRDRVYSILYENTEMDVPPETVSAIKSDLAQRWLMSQVIASEREVMTVTDKQQGTTTRMLALTVVFHGFPAMSFQVLFNPKDGKLQYYRTGNDPRFISYCYQDKSQR